MGNTRGDHFWVLLPSSGLVRFPCRVSRSGDRQDFLRFYIATSKSQIDDRPSAVGKWFFAGFTRVTVRFAYKTP